MEDLKWFISHMIDISNDPCEREDYYLSLLTNAGYDIEEAMKILDEYYEKNSPFKIKDIKAEGVHDFPWFDLEVSDTAHDMGGCCSTISTLEGKIIQAVYDELTYDFMKELYYDDIITEEDYYEYKGDH